MALSPINKEQALNILKVTLYVSVSAGIDYLISISTGSQFGIYTPIINILLVTIKKLFTTPEK
jgi:hypothetical protein